MSKFPDDHRIERVRGRKRPSRAQVKKELAMRIAWLERKIESSDTDTNPSTNPFTREILCLAVAGDLLEGEDVDAMVETLKTAMKAMKESAASQPEVVKIPVDEYEELLMAKSILEGGFEQ